MQTLTDRCYLCRHLQLNGVVNFADTYRGWLPLQTLTDTYRHAGWFNFADTSTHSHFSHSHHHLICRHTPSSPPLSLAGSKTPEQLEFLLDTQLGIQVVLARFCMPPSSPQPRIFTFTAIKMQTRSCGFALRSCFLFYFSRPPFVLVLRLSSWNEVLFHPLSPATEEQR